ncbi:glycosyltransferase family protein [Nocardioides sambongensis]|uniref:glycosyltransferase family protein n=1 Tax=Nocardioides sambongensis TaxID=2589074 RepID=UPI0015E833E8|nr:glycosyltransferase [Nocardioides sambongensis]
MTARTPLVTIVAVLERGFSERLVDTLDRTIDGERHELVVVANGVAPAVVPDLTSWPGALQLIVNDQRVRLGPATCQAIRASTGEFIVLAHDDLEVLEPRWLDQLVEGFTDGVVATGPAAGAAYFEPSNGGARPVPAPARSGEAPVITGCLAIRRSDLLATLPGDLAPAATEWDHCLRLGAYGRLAVIDRPLVRLHGDGFREVSRRDGRTQRNADLRSFNRIWGPSLLRRLREEVSDDTQTFFRAPGSLMLKLVTGSPAQGEPVSAALTEQAQAAGWSTTTGRPPSADLAIALGPPKDVQWLAGQGLSVAAVVDDVAGWTSSGALDAAHVVLAGDDRTAARLEAAWGSGNVTVEPRLRQPGPGLLRVLRDAARPRPDTLRIGVSTCAPDWPTARFWGDTHLARGLGRALRRCGHEAVELTVDDWERQAAAACDVVVHLRGLRRRPAATGQWNVLWVISHPDRIEPGECDEYDLVASASAQHAEQLSQQLRREVYYLPQATDADTFRIGPTSAAYDGAVLYVGNARWPHRRAPRWLLRTGCDFDLYGKNWEDFPEARFVRDEYIANRDLPAAYRSAALVVADHHGSMRTNGFVANRLFDVLASGGVVLSDNVPGLSLLFDDLVPTYQNPDELRGQVHRLVAEPTRRRELAASGRDLVLREHTLDHRAFRLLELLDSL